MRFTAKQRELAGLALAAGLVAIVGEMLKPKAVHAFKAKRKRIPL